MTAVVDTVNMQPTARTTYRHGDLAAALLGAGTDLFKTAYETDPRQIEHVNRMSALARARGMPVVWSRVGYMASAADAGVWGTRTDTEDSLQNIKYEAERHAFDPRGE